MSLPTVDFLASRTIIPTKAYARLIPQPILACSGANATDLFTATGHTFVADDPVYLDVLTGLTGITSGVFYVLSPATNTFQLSATKGGSPVNFTADGTGNVGKVCDLVGKVVNYDEAIETVQREIPDTDGLLRADRMEAKSRKQTLKFEVEDIKLASSAFGSSNDISGGFTKGTAELWITDPNDASSKVAIHALGEDDKAFNAAWHTEGGIGFQTKEVSKMTIVINPLEKMVLRVDSAA